MVIAIGSDHRGYRLKEPLKKYLDSAGIKYIDYGTNSEESVDYPDYAKKVGESILSGESQFGILICGSGIGVSIAANKIKGIRAVNVNTKDLAVMSRMHNNANVICFGSDFIGLGQAIEFLHFFLETSFEGGERHERRIKKLE